MKAARSLFLVALALLALGAVSFSLQPVLDPEPDSECAAQGAPSSGFVDKDKDDCNITQESYDEINDWQTKPKPYRIAGLVLVVAGVIVGIIALVRSRRRE